MLAALDLTAPEAKPIVKLLEGIPSTLRFVLENNLDHIRAVGQNTETPCGKCCAVIFGKVSARLTAVSRPLCPTLNRALRTG